MRRKGHNSELPVFKTFEFYLSYETICKKLEIYSPAHVFAEQLGGNTSLLNKLIVETVGQ